MGNIMINKITTNKTFNRFGVLTVINRGLTGCNSV